MFNTRTALSALLMTVALLFTACGNNTAESAAASPVVDEAIADLVDLLAPAYADVAGVWPDFDPLTVPVVIPIANDGEVLGALALNHSNPDGLGTATEVDAGTAFTSAHRITDVVDQELFDRLQTFAFNLPLGGVDTFAIRANVDGSLESGFGTNSPDFPAFLLHEMFHRVQFEQWTFNIAELTQDFDSYPRTVESLTQSALEDRALIAAVTAETPAERDAAAQHFSALRIVRQDEHGSSVTVESAQERIEGTARYLEHQFGDEASGITYHATNFTQALQPNFQEQVAQYWFEGGRFYATGAAIHHVLDEMGIDDTSERISAGETPAALLSEVVLDSDADIDQLVAQAIATYDADGALAETAAEALERSALEVPNQNVTGNGLQDADGNDIDFDAQYGHSHDHNHSHSH